MNIDKQKLALNIGAAATALGGVLNLGFAFYQKKQWEKLNAQTWTDHEASMFAHDKMVREAFTDSSYAGLSEEELEKKISSDYEFYRIQRIHEIEAMTKEQRKYQLKMYKDRADAVEEK